MVNEFPSSLFIYNAQQVISDILKRRFDDMWRSATPVDIENINNNDNIEKR